MKEEDIEGIIGMIAKIAPQYTAFGGSVEFMDVKDEKVRIRTNGNCHR